MNPWPGHTGTTRRRPFTLLGYVRLREIVGPGGLTAGLVREPREQQTERMSISPVPHHPVWAQFRVDPRQAPQMRLSDRDRDAAREVLAGAYADGQLNHTEYSERLDRASEVVTFGELVPVIGDLTVTTPHTLARPTAEPHRWSVVRARGGGSTPPSRSWVGLRAHWWPSTW